jgi:hypothetical protein
MPKSDQEVFDHFHSDYDSSPEIALLAYARYAQDKYEWMDHQKTRGKNLTDENVTEWITSLPNPTLRGIHDRAIRFFNEAAEDYMKARMEEDRAKAVERSILARVETMAERVERATSFKATVWPNVLIGVVASLLFTVLVLVGAAIYRGDPSIFALFKEAPIPARPAPGT